MSIWLIIALAAAGLAALFFGAYLLARRMDNYGIVDIVWSYAFGALAIFYATTLAGWAPRRWALTTLVVIWSARLGTHLYRRVISHHPEEDSRYHEMRARWAGNFATKMVVFYQQQAFSVLVLGLPFLLVGRNPATGFRPLEIVGAAVWLFALLGEATADAQLHAFKKDPANKGKVCDAGLWSYSRHPNYFCEGCIWIGFWIFACASPWGWPTVICPVAMIYLLLCVTGVPLAEEQSLRSRGDAYRRYQHRVSVFVPWFPKK